MRLGRPLALSALLVAGCATDSLEIPARQPDVQQAAHPRYAPPPLVTSHWCPSLAVYVVEGQAHVFYRERVFYYWNSRWYWSTQVLGPWQLADTSAVPPALVRHYQGRK